MTVFGKKGRNNGLDPSTWLRTGSKSLQPFGQNIGNWIFRVGYWILKKYKVKTYES